MLRNGESHRTFQFDDVRKLSTVAYKEEECREIVPSERKKLTLSVDERLITKVKRFSTRNQTTVSELFSDFVSTLEDDGGGPASVLDRLTGILSEETSREDYREHLREKHLG